MTITIKTRRVIFQASVGVGQVTLRSSPTVSRQKRWIRSIIVNFFFFLAATSLSLLTSKTPPLIDGVEKFQAGQVGIEPTTPAFGERCSAKLSYWPVHVVKRLLKNINSPASSTYFTSRCMVCSLHRGQYFFNSIRPGSLRRFFSLV